MGSACGGAAAVAWMALVELSASLNLANSGSIGRAIQVLSFYLVATAVVSLARPIGGILFGALPTILLGSTLHLLSRWWLFRSQVLWAAAGGLAGAIIGRMNWVGRLATLQKIDLAWANAWVVGGAILMIVYHWSALRKDRP